MRSVIAVALLCLVVVSVQAASWDYIYEHLHELGEHDLGEYDGTRDALQRMDEIMENELVPLARELLSVRASKSCTPCVLHRHCSHNIVSGKKSWSA